MKVFSVKHADYLGEKDANDILKNFGKDAIIKKQEKQNYGHAKRRNNI